MFTGIIENSAVIEEAVSENGNRIFWLDSPLTPELKVDQSISHDGVCLTIEEIRNNLYRVTAIGETLLKTNLNTWQPGDQINLERCMLMNGRLDGHIVQGHVDTTAVCIRKTDIGGSVELTFSVNGNFAELMIEKGSICINGISLTLYNVSENQFTVSIIPYTLNHTNINGINVNGIVNIEFDVIGKYVARIARLKSS